MKNSIYFALLGIIGMGFALFFFVTIPGPFFANPDIVAAVSAGFVNPFAAGFSTDTTLCWLILVVWVLREKFTLGVRHGWVAVLIGLVPGVATGLALYLVLRTGQLSESKS